MEKFKKDCNSIVAACAAVLKQLTEQRNSAIRDYQGDRLEKEIKTIDDAIRTAKRKGVQQIKDAAENAKARIQGEEINGKHLTPDFNLLDPHRVKLTQAEFDEIAERNKGNRAMSAALRTYARRVKLTFNAGFDTERMIQIVDNIARQAVNSVYSPAAFDADIAERMGNATVL